MIKDVDAARPQTEGGGEIEGCLPYAAECGPLQPFSPIKPACKDPPSTCRQKHDATITFDSHLLRGM